MKTRRWEDRALGQEGISFWGEGCDGPHAVPTSGPGAWTWNGDRERPVLSPSLLTRWTSGPEHTPHVCHTFVGCSGAQPGEIIYLGDCTHQLGGQVRPLADWPSHED